jgi:C4-dicarboxylate-specific signal transduction histidine kinase
MSTAIPGLHDAQLAFVGLIIAGVSHEFKNHLSVTKELSGLLDDLLTVGKDSLPGGERLTKITSGIEERIAAAAEMANYLGRFAHRMDFPLSSFSVNEVVGEIMFLTQRFARLKDIVLVLDPAPELPPLHNNPSLLQFVIFSVAMPMFDHLEKQGVVRIATGAAENRIRIALHFDRIRKKETAELPRNIPNEALQGMRAEYSFDQPDPGTARAILLLSQIPAGT